VLFHPCLDRIAMHLGSSGFLSLGPHEAPIIGQVTQHQLRWRPPRGFEPRLTQSAIVDQPLTCFRSESRQ
jgi:hypothetical protein